MRTEIEDLLRRQAEWQRARRQHSWAEKLRDSVSMRRALTDLKKRPGRPSKPRMAVRLPECANVHTAQFMEQLQERRVRRLRRKEEEGWPRSG